jgi:hypothetical protein
MTGSFDAWFLPASEAFFAKLEDGLSQGLVLIPAEPARPAGLEGELKKRLHRSYPEIEVIENEAEKSPAENLAAPLGAQPNLEALLSPSLDQTLVLIKKLGPGDSNFDAWTIFLDRFALQRAQSDMGIACIVLNAPETLIKLENRLCLSWTSQLRRLDLAIWADLHTTPGRDDLTTALASALAVELCGWRLDLAAAMAQASIDDLADPRSWLKGRDEKSLADTHSIGRRRLDCPLALIRGNNQPEIDRRIWRAQLTAVFPWLEEERQKLIAQHRRALQVDDHLHSLGVHEIDEIELGALQYQLSGKLTASDNAWLCCMAQIRNCLAHRKPARSEQLRLLLKNAQKR